MTRRQLVDERAARVCHDWRDGRLDAPRARATLLLLALSPSLVGPAAGEQAVDASPVARGRMHTAMVELLQVKVLDDSPAGPLSLDAVADGRTTLSAWVDELLAAAGPFLRRRLRGGAGADTASPAVTSIR